MSGNRWHAGGRGIQVEEKYRELGTDRNSPVSENDGKGGK